MHRASQLRTVLAVIASGGIVFGCTQGPSTSPSGASPSVPATATVTPTAAPVAAAEMTIAVPFIGGNQGLNGELSNAGQQTGGFAIGPLFMYQALFRRNDRLETVPDLADGPCDISNEGKVVTCRLAGSTFHDGTPVTADDVAYEYQIVNSDYGIFPNPPDLVGVRAVDPRTVEFTLSAPSAVFLGSLAVQGIDPRHVLEAQYGAIRPKALAVGKARLDAAADAIRTAFDADIPDCAPLLPAAEAILREAGVEPWDRAEFPAPQGDAFDPCSYADSLALMLDVTSGSLFDRDAGKVVDGIDAVAAAYRILPISRHPVGSGPFQFDRYVPGRELVLRAFPGYQHGPTATSSVRFQVIQDPDALVEGLRSGAIDWAPRFTTEGNAIADALTAVGSLPGVRLTTMPSTGFNSLAFNLRAGRLFADVRLRQALERCIDKPAIVEAASGGEAVPIYGPILPSSWAYQARPAVTRDVAAARTLIEAAGWTKGADGIYTLKGRRLAAEIPVRDNRPDRVKFAELVALQARDCGFQLTAKPTPFGDLIDMLWNYPHLLPGKDTPFDVYLAGWSITTDPGDSLDLFDSRNVSSKALLDGKNFGGFVDPEVDRLFATGLTSYVQADRARAYKAAQIRIADELPYLFGYALIDHDAMTDRLESTAGPLAFDSLFWAWQVETLVVRR